MSGEKAEGQGPAREFRWWVYKVRGYETLTLLSSSRPLVRTLTSMRVFGDRNIYMVV